MSGQAFWVITFRNFCKVTALEAEIFSRNIGGFVSDQCCLYELDFHPIFPNDPGCINTGDVFVIPSWMEELPNVVL